MLTTATAILQSPGAPISPPVAWTPESVLISIGFGVITVLLAMVAWLGKKQFDCILETMQTFITKQQACREDLAQRFADKADVSINIKELYQRTEKHESELHRQGAEIKGLRNWMNRQEHLLHEHSAKLGGRRIDDLD